MTPQRYPEPGSMLGRFRVERCLGAGGMGVVLEATETGLDRRVAVKLIDARLADDPGFRARFEQEARIMAALDSPYVLGVHSFGEVDGRLYLATPLATGGDLARLVRSRGPLSVAVALDLARQVAAGLADAHAAGLLHRDVKPANVLLRPVEGGWAALLADFGVAHPDGSVGRDEGGVGTPAYLAPEVRAGAPASVSSEVYAVGCLLWAALTGRPPDPAHPDAGSPAPHRSVQVPRLPGGDAATRAVDAVLGRALETDPARRQPSAGALRDELAAAAELVRLAGAERAGRDPPTHRRGLPPAAGGRGRRLLLAATALPVGLGISAALAGGGGAPGAGEAAGGLDRAAVQARARDHLDGVPGLEDVPVRCAGGLPREVGAVQHCTVRTGTGTGWLRVRVAGGDTGATGGTAVEVELPPAALERIVRERYADRGEAVVVRCRSYLRGRPGARTTCVTPTSPHGDRVLLVVTRVVDLLVVFDIRSRRSCTNCAA